MLKKNRYCEPCIPGFLSLFYLLSLKHTFLIPNKRNEYKNEKIEKTACTFIKSCYPIASGTGCFLNVQNLNFNNCTKSKARKSRYISLESPWFTIYFDTSRCCCNFFASCCNVCCKPRKIDKVITKTKTNCPFSENWGLTVYAQLEVIFSFCTKLF